MGGSYLCDQAFNIANIIYAFQTVFLFTFFLIRFDKWMPFCFLFQMHDRYIEIKTFFNSHLNFHKAELLQVVSSPFICNVVYLHDKFYQ